MSCFGMMVWPVLLIRKAAGAVMQMKPAGNVLTAAMVGYCDARLV
jgi:hypothetical protein